MSMVYEVMKECNNFFDMAYIEGRFEISDDGVITPNTAIISGQYIAIEGSTSHNGVYACTDGWLGYDEEIPFGESFTGRVWLLSPPPAFIRLCREIAAFQRESEKVTGPYTSESFGGYSYQRASGANGGMLTWQEQFRKRIDPYRAMFTEVNL